MHKKKVQGRATGNTLNDAEMHFFTLEEVDHLMAVQEPSCGIFDVEDTPLCLPLQHNY